MTKKDFSHFKYYAKRLKEMGFKTFTSLQSDNTVLGFVKKTNNTCTYIVARFGNERQGFDLTFSTKKSRTLYEYYVGCFDDEKFKEMADDDYERFGWIITKYPTWRSAFNQLVKDFHELEKNAHKRIHKGVSIHET